MKREYFLLSIRDIAGVFQVKFQCPLLYIVFQCGITPHTKRGRLLLLWELFPVHLYDDGEIDLYLDHVDWLQSTHPWFISFCQGWEGRSQDE